MTNAAVGAELTFFSPDGGTLELKGRASITAIERTAELGHLTAAGQAVAKANKVAQPQLYPVDTNYTTADGKMHSRVWLVTVDRSPPRGVTYGGMLLNLVDWDGSGARLINNYFHGGVDGVRWKSSNGVISGNRWEKVLANSQTGLEVTPLQAFYEGPFTITNVSITGNTFTGVAPDNADALITVCKGFGHKYNFTGCKGAVHISGNKFVPSLKSDDAPYVDVFGGPGEVCSGAQIVRTATSLQKTRVLNARGSRMFSTRHVVFFNF